MKESSMFRQLAIGHKQTIVAWTSIDEDGQEDNDERYHSPKEDEEEKETDY